MAENILHRWRRKLCFAEGAVNRVGRHELDHFFELISGYHELGVKFIATHEH